MAYDFTSTQAGNWSASATWGGGTAPVGAAAAGKTISLKHHVTIDTANMSAIGATGAGNGVNRIDLSATAAYLDNTTAGPLTIYWNSSGSDPIGTATGPDGGAVGAGHPGADAACKGINQAFGTISLIGTAVNPITITSVDNASPWYLAAGWGVLTQYNAVTVTLKYVIAQHIGVNNASAFFAGIAYYGYGGGSGIDIENCLFTDPFYVVYYGSGQSAGNNPLTALNNTIDTPRGVSTFCMIAASGTHPHTVSGNTWLAWSPPAGHVCIQFFGAGAHVANENVAVYTSTTHAVGLIGTGTTATGSSFARNVLLAPAAGTGGTVVTTAVGASGTTITDCYGVGLYNVVPAYGSAGQGTTCSGLYGRQYSAQATGQGIIAIGYSGTHSFSNCIAVDGDGTTNKQGFLLYDVSGTNSSAALIEHCTFYGVTGANNTDFVMFSDGGSWPCQASRARANLFVGNGGNPKALTDPFASTLHPAGVYYTGASGAVDAGNNLLFAPNGYSPIAADVGKFVQITTSTGGWSAGCYIVQAITSGKWQLDRSPAAVGTTGATWNFWVRVQYTQEFSTGSGVSVGVHHNATYGLAVVDGATVNSGLGSTGFTDGVHTHPNAAYGDVDGQSPNFVAPTRTELTWSTSLGGAGTVADLATQFGNRCGVTGSSYNASYTVAALKAYVFAGFAPTNIALDAILPGDANTVKTAGAVAYLAALTAGTVSTSSVTQTTLTVATTAASGGLAPYSYQFQRAPDSSGSPGAWAGVGTAGSGTSYNDTGLTAATIYWYRVQATDANTSSSLSGAVSATTLSASPTTATISGPSSGTVSVESTAFTVTLNLAALAGGQVVSLASTGSGDVFHAVGGGGSVSSVTIAFGQTVGSFYLVPGALGARTITPTSPGITFSPTTLAYASNAALATSYTLTGPSSSVVGSASANFTVSPVGGVYTGTVTPHAGALTGTFSPSALTFAASSAAQTFTFTPTAAGTGTISTTASPTLGTDPAAVAFTASLATVGIPPSRRWYPGLT